MALRSPPTPAKASIVGILQQRDRSVSDLGREKQLARQRLNTPLPFFTAVVGRIWGLGGLGFTSGVVEVHPVGSPEIHSAMEVDITLPGLRWDSGRSVLVQVAARKQMLNAGGKSICGLQQHEWPARPRSVAAFAGMLGGT